MSPVTTPRTETTRRTAVTSPAAPTPTHRCMALQDGTDGGNGVYSYGGDQFPTSSYGSSNYWVDPIFWTSAPPNAPACPCSIWPASTQPSVASVSETSAVNLGVQFTPQENGWITGIRFYKGSGNTGTHVGSLWTASGTCSARSRSPTSRRPAGSRRTSQARSR